MRLIHCRNGEVIPEREYWDRYIAEFEARVVAYERRYQLSPYTAVERLRRA